MHSMQLHLEQRTKAKEVISAAKSRGQFEAVVKNEARDQNLRSKIGLETGMWDGLRKFRI